MIAVAETPYCRLYLDTEEARETVQAQLDRSIATDFDSLTVFASVFQNHCYEKSRVKQRAYDPIERSPWTAEVDTEQTDLESSDRFEAGIVKMIRGLRGLGMRVTASCDFEDRITRETGWNWSVDTPEPPD